MRVAVLGATGRIGRAIAAEARSRGHEVRALVRDPGALDEEPTGGAFACEATDPAAIADAARGCDVLVSAVGGAAEGRFELVVEAAHALVEAATAIGIRLFVVGGAGTLAHPAGGTVNSQPDFPEAWKGGSEAQGRALEVFRAADGRLDWTYLSPAHVIEPGERTGRYRTGTDALVVDEAGESRISIADYAVAAVDELERPRFRGRRFTIAY